jgi:hypothetical protein
LETIFIVTHEPFSESVYERYSLSILLTNYKIVYYDLSRVFYEKNEKSYFVEGITVISVFRDNYLSFLSSNIQSKSIIFCFLEFNHKTIWVFALFRLKKCILIYYNAYFTPFPKNSINNIQKVLRVFSLNSLKYKFINFFLVIIRLLTGIAYYNLEFMCSVKVTKARRYVSINHPDIEIINRVEKINKLSNYIVYIDELFPDHPDFKHQSSHLNFKEFNILEYKKNIYDFLVRTAEQNNIEVVIAKHPRRIGNFFEDSKFPEFLNMTHDLIKYSSGVILSQSASIGIAIYCKKPIVLVNSNSYPSFLSSRISFFSNELNISAINFFETPNFRIKFDFDRYEEYINNYLVFSENANDRIMLRELLNLTTNN